jgi:hypothetical protein
VIRIYAFVGEIDDEQLDFLIDNLEEEWADDRDYYLNRDMLAMLEEKGADRGLLDVLRNAIGDKDEVEFVWVDTEEEEEDEDDNS